MRQRIGLLLLLLGTVVALPSATAATYVVTKTADTEDGACDQDCSLREAILAANGDSEASTVLLGTGVYLIQRPGTGEDAGHTGDFDVSGDLILRGVNAKDTILDGNDLDRVLHNLTGALTLENVTVRNGTTNASGGGILSDRHDSSLRLDSVVIADNVAADDGGGIIAYNFQAFRSAIVRNQAGERGGGAFTAGTKLENVTVSGNRATSVGGGLYLAVGFGDTYDHLTVTANQGGGIYGQQPDCPSDPTCFPDTYLSNSIVAGNLGGPDCSGIGTGGFNIYGLLPGCGVADSDRTGTALQPLDPRLGPLTEAAGFTPVHPLLPGSPALDTANIQNCPALDQRGAARPADGDGNGNARCDVGAFELTDSCVPDITTLCLAGNRFRVTAHWHTSDASGTARAVPLTDTSGTFWFFSPDNIELIAKTVDGCSLNQHHWFFITGLTNVGVHIDVLDTKTGVSTSYENGLGEPFPPILDTSALATCP